MHPIIFRITDTLAIKSYGVAIAVAFFVAIFLSARRAKAMGYRFNDFVDLGFWIIISSIVGARLFYILFHIRPYLEDPASVLKIWRGGLIFYGGFLCATAATFIFLKKKGIPAWVGADIIAPHVALGYAITRLGCFFNGCCFGKATSLPWGVTFPPGTGAGNYGVYLILSGQVAPPVHLHPTQLYASLINLAFFVVLTLLWQRRVFDGMVFWTYVGLYSLYRFGIEFLRGDNLPLFFNLTTAQFLSIALLLVTAVALVHLSRRRVLTLGAAGATGRL